VEGNHLI